MSTSRRRATLASLVGSTGNILIVSIQAVVLIPLYLGAIGPRLYGAWLGSGDILLWMNAFDLGLPNLMIQRIGAAHGREDFRAVAEYVATGMVVLALASVAIALCASLVAHPLPRWMGLTGEEANTLRMCFLVSIYATAVNIFNNSMVGFSRGIQDTTFVNIMLIVSGILGFGVSLALVLTGWGLWAVALGLVTRAVVSLCAGLFFTASALRHNFMRHFRVRRAILREFALVCPASALGGLSYSVMNQSQAILVAIVLRPELATIFVLTRKAAEVCRSLLDTIAFSTYGAFAHLVTSGQRYRALQVHAEITSWRLSLSVLLASAYIAVNPSLVSVWVGTSQYGGDLLTILLATEFIVVGGSFLMNYLYRATGPIVRGSVALFLESIFRVPFMVVLCLWLGLPGVPLAGIAIAGMFGWLAYRWTLKEMASFSQAPHFSSLLWIARAAILGLGILVCLFNRTGTWLHVVIPGTAIILIGGIVLILIDPLLNTARAPVSRILDRLGIILPQ